MAAMQSPLRSLNNIRPLLRGRLPGQLVIQYSNRCNADCPQCGMRRSEKIARSTLDKDHVKNLIDNAAEKGIKSLSFTGGEPLIFLDDIVELTNHASAAGIPYVRTGTNGFIFRDSESLDFENKISRIAEKLAGTKLYTFWISLDSAEPGDHEAMRGLAGVVRGIEKALPIFHTHGIYPSVNLGINRATGGRLKQPFLRSSGEDEFLAAFKDSFARFYQLVHNLGFTIVNACYPMSSAPATDAAVSTDLQTSLYGAASSDSIITFSEKEKALIFRALYETIPEYRGKLRIFSPRCSLYSLIRKFGEQRTPLFPCRGGADFFFVECEKGKIHPCGYREEPVDELPDLATRFGKIVDCDKCEWECFRDPSDVLGPFADLFSQPFKLAGKIINEPHFFRLLIEDLRYYRACGYFNGRIAPQTKAMQRFALSPAC
ncbi:MAG: radical SAM protein [Desulfobulbaceae bacterium]|nr:MAG: radical SAM protein [Desulfobulbaceae bacterium]